MINPLLLSGGEVTPPEPPYIIDRSIECGGGFYTFGRTRDHTDSPYYIWDAAIGTSGQYKGTISFWRKDLLVANAYSSNVGYRTILSCANVPENLPQQFLIYSNYSTGVGSTGFRSDAYYIIPDGANVVPVDMNVISYDSWVHWLISYDTTQAVASDRLSLYMNGEKINLYSINDTVVPQNKIFGFFRPDYRIHFSATTRPASRAGAGMIADLYAIPGAEYGPEKFGKTQNGQWVPIEWPDAIPSTNGGFFAEFKTGDSLNEAWKALNSSPIAVGDYGASLGTGSYGGEFTGEDPNFAGRAVNGNLSDYTISNDVSPGGQVTWTTSQVGPNDLVEVSISPAGGNGAASGEQATLTGTNITTVTITSDGVIDNPQWYTVRAANTGLAFTDLTLTHLARRDLFGWYAIRVNGEVLTDFLYGKISYTFQSPTKDTSVTRTASVGTPGRYAGFPRELANKNCHGFGSVGGYAGQTNLTNTSGWTNYKSDLHVVSGKWGFQLSSKDDTACSDYAVGLVERHWGGQEDPVALGSSGPENFMWELVAGTVWVNGSSVATVPVSSGETATVLYDADTGDVRLYVESTLEYTGTAALNSAYGYAIHHGQRGGVSTAGSFRINTGDRPWQSVDLIALGYKPWLESDITPTLPSPAAPTSVHNYQQYVPTGSALSVATTCDADFFKVSKQYSTSAPTVREDHIHDGLRGVAALPKGTGAESTISQGVISVSGNTVNIGTDLNYNDSANGNVYAVAAWSAPTSSTNTSGTVSANLLTNTTSGMSIATWTNQGGSYTIGHGLSETPKLIIVRNRASNNWIIGGLIDNHQFNVVDWTQALDANGAGTWASNNIFNNTAPTSSLITFNGGNAAMGTDMVAYIFHEVEGLSCFGRWNVNWAAEATGLQMFFGAAYCGFRPATILSDGGSAQPYWFHDGNETNLFTGVTTPGAYLTFPELFTGQTDEVVGAGGFSHSLMPASYGFVGKGLSNEKFGLGTAGYQSFWTWAKDGNISTMAEIFGPNGKI